MKRPALNEYWMVDPKLHTVEQYSLVKDKSDQPVFQLTAELAVSEVIISTLLAAFSVPVKAFFDLTIRQQAILSMTRRAPDQDD